MGLDMYLNKEIYIGAEYEHRKITGTIDLKEDGKPINIDLKKVSTIKERTGYWRKANHIHKWFVDNVQSGNDDCKNYYVSSDNLKKLLETCKKVKENPKLAEELLPTQEGFFFGGTEYDKYYFQDIEDTIKICEEALKDTKNDFYYHSSW